MLKLPFSAEVPFLEYEKLLLEAELRKYGKDKIYTLLQQDATSYRGKMIRLIKVRCMVLSG